MNINLLRQLGQSTQIVTLSDFQGSPTFRFQMQIEENPDDCDVTFSDDFYILKFKFNNPEGDTTDVALLTEDIQSLNDFTLEVEDKEFFRTRAMPLYLYLIARYLNKQFTISIPDLGIFIKVNPLQASQLNKSCPMELVYVANWSTDKSDGQVEAEAKAYVASMNASLTMQG